LRHIAHSINDCQYELCGSKLIKVHMQRHDIWPEDLQKIFPNAGFIILYRRSILEQLLSLKIAEKTDMWLWSNQFRIPEEITITADELVTFHGIMQEFYQRLLEDPAVQRKSVVISYEELCENPQRTFDEKLFPFLGSMRFGVRNHLKKQNSKRPEEILSNFKELIRMKESELILEKSGSVLIESPLEML
jgi:hypothetical protein